MSPSAMKSRTASTPAMYEARSRLEVNAVGPMDSSRARAGAGAGFAEPLDDVRQAPVERCRVAVRSPAADPGRAGPAVPGDDPVVEREAERRQVLVVGRDRRQPLERVAQVVAEVADEAAKERR